MPVFVSSKSAAGNAHGVFALDQTNAPLVQLTSTNVACLVGQFPWGPSQQIVSPASPKDRLNTFAPFGMDHTGSGYLSIIRKAWPDLRIIRVLSSTAQNAGAFLLDGSSNVIGGIGAKYNGTAGNSITVTVSNASDGDPNHFNASITIAGSGGSTTDLLENLNYSGIGGDSVVDLTNSLLVGLVFGGVSGGATAGRPVNGTTTMSGGTDGTLVSGDYVGTAGTGDKGIALAEGDDEIRQIFTDDCGSLLRNAVNSGLTQHAESMGDRVAFMAGDSGMTIAQTQTDVDNYRSTRVVYMDPWVMEADDVDGTLHALPPQSFGASVASQLPPSTSIAWKSGEVGSMLNGITSLQPGGDRGSARVSNTNHGIVTIFKFAGGGFRFEADPTTIAPITPAKKSLRRTRVGDAIAISFTDSVRDQVDAPNVPVVQQQLMNALNRLLANLKNAQNRDPAHEFFIKDYSPPVIGSTASEIQQGELEIDIDVQVGAAAERIFLGINFGETVTISAS
jgi:hypothetical protein